MTTSASANARSTSPPLDSPGEGLVPGQIRVEAGSSGSQGLIDGGDDGQRIIIDFDQIDCIPGSGGSLRYYNRHGVPYKTDPIVLQKQGFRLLNLLVVSSRGAKDDGRRLDDLGIQVRSRQDLDHAAALRCLLGVNAPDSRMRIGTAQEDGMQGAPTVDVGHVAALTGDQSGVFTPPDTGSNELREGGVRFTFHVSGSTFHLPPSTKRRQTR